ncbi:hypothetical protein BXZ70DRAFT_105347 [Cristinia sonorae]|uniref:DUF2828 domain-containing protein n=1 Tax=Cristinia sonorae TaxID=1940300 RepID=A0A8K0UQ51_9AGAR|nr:hypothetical protein BXZ70DRAFT_105347 [Cristinia sonorae]
MVNEPRAQTGHGRKLLPRKVKARSLREKRFAELHGTLLPKLANTRSFRALYVFVADLFVDQLVKYILVLDRLTALPPGPQSVKERQALSRQISLAGKWGSTPSNSRQAYEYLHRYHDAHTLPEGVQDPERAFHCIRLPSSRFPIRSLHSPLVLPTLGS